MRCGSSVPFIGRTMSVGIVTMIDVTIAQRDDGDASGSDFPSSANFRHQRMQQCIYSCGIDVPLTRWI